jgi:hypothetical protein
MGCGRRPSGALATTSRNPPLRHDRPRHQLLSTLRAAVAETDRLARLADDLLILAHTDAADGALALRAQPVDLDDPSAPSPPATTATPNRPALHRPARLHDRRRPRRRRAARRRHVRRARPHDLGAEHHDRGVGLDALPRLRPEPVHRVALQIRRPRGPSSTGTSRRNRWSCTPS